MGHENQVVDLSSLPAFLVDTAYLSGKQETGSIWLNNDE